MILANVHDTDTVTPDDDALNWYDDQPPEMPPPDTWDDVHADRMLAALVAARRRREAEAAVWRRRIEELTERADELAARHADRIGQLETALTAWMLQRREQHGTKSVSLPSGRIKTRTVPDRVWVGDDMDPDQLPSDVVAVVPAKLVVRKPAVAAALKAGRLVATPDGQIVDTDTGEVVPGIGIVAGGVSVSFAPAD